MARQNASPRVSRREGRTSRKEQRSRNRNDLPLINSVEVPAANHIRKKAVKVEPRTVAQEMLDRSIEINAITFAVGPWGTGKTWLEVARAAQAFQRGDIAKIILTRPAVAADEELGFLPGDLDEKWAPWFKPMRDVLAEILGSGHLDYAMRDGRIEIAPLGFLRGNTFKDAWVIADEMQNATPRQMKMFLSRIGENAKLLINGDPRQQDISGLSGLDDALDRLVGRVALVGFVEFKADDIVRSGIAKQIFLAYH